MALIVQKYGGTSVGSTDRISSVAQNIAKSYKDGNQLVIVVSAMSGETNRLLNLAKNITNSNKNKELDTLASTGEQITIALLSLALQKINIPAKSYCGWQIPIITTNDYTQARIKHIPIE
jgi:aspartate kinase